MSAQPGVEGTALFWASLLAFVVVDVELFTGPHLPPQVVGYALLAAFALALAFVAGVVLGAVRRRRWPSLSGLVPAALLLAVVAAHAVMVIAAKRR